MKREFHVRYLGGDLRQTERQFQTEALARDFMEKCKRPILDAWVTAPIPIPANAVRQ